MSELMILRSIFIVVIVSALVWLRAHNDGEKPIELSLPDFSETGGQISQKMMDYCLENPKKCQKILKTVNGSSESE